MCRHKRAAPDAEARGAPGKNKAENLRSFAHRVGLNRWVPVSRPHSIYKL